MMRITPVWLPTILAVLSAMLTGCLAAPMPTITPMPTLIIHPKPNLNINQAIYEKLGCDPSERCDTEGTELAASGCTQLWSANSLLGGLSPAYPLAQCSWMLHGPGPGLYKVGCTEPLLVGLVVLREGQYQVVASYADLRTLYAPIESEVEALSYATLGTGFQVVYFEEAPRDIVFLRERLEDTHVTKVDDGYRVSLYVRADCGCSYHETSAVDVLVTVDGEIRESARVPVYREKNESCED